MFNRLNVIRDSADDRLIYRSEKQPPPNQQTTGGFFLLETGWQLQRGEDEFLPATVSRLQIVMRGFEFRVASQVSRNVKGRCLQKGG